MEDELMEEIHDEAPVASFEVYFQFQENEPIKFASVYDGNTFSLTLDASHTETPEVNFNDGKGNNFKMFTKKCS